MRNLKTLLVSMLIIGLMAGSAMAQSYIADNGNTGIGWEATNLNGFTTNQYDLTLQRHFHI